MRFVGEWWNGEGTEEGEASSERTSARLRSCWLEEIDRSLCKHQ